MMKDILEALKILQVNQIQLSSTVDAISGRVNVLAGMKEVQEVALPLAAVALPSKPEPEETIHDEPAVPESPSLPATAVDGSGSQDRFLLLDMRGRRVSVREGLSSQ